jgi:hypothetical protein
MTKKVENPWEGMNGPNYYSDRDKEIINTFNKKLEKKDKENNIISKKEDSIFYIDLRLMPEPYMGNKDANVILLFTNPGLKKTELQEYDEYPDFYESLKNNLTHSNTEYPYYYFNPAFKKLIKGKEKYIAGAEWILRRTKELRKAIGDNHLQILSKGLFTFQLHPYHSKRYKNLPKLEVDEYTDYLFKASVQKAKDKGALVICVRNYDQWNDRYQKVFETENDFATDLSDNFILLKDKTGKAPRTPYFTTHLLRLENFDDLINKLK